MKQSWEALDQLRVLCNKKLFSPLLDPDVPGSWFPAFVEGAKAAGTAIGILSFPMMPLGHWLLRRVVGCQHFKIRAH